MLDYEDEMDVDAPVADTSISFGGDQKKGKRTAANLPIEAEDSLPWYDSILGVRLPNTDSWKGRKIQTKLIRRCRRPQGHHSHNQQVRRLKCT